jgi:sterol desaturase/sphingolipid hydroxylase (fatty acid hydroxylase superfamily)
MEYLKILYDEFISFFSIGPLLKMFSTGDYSSLHTLDGILSAIGPIIPFLLVIEIIRALVYKRFRIEDYKVPFFIFVFNRIVSRFISIAVIAFCISLFEKRALVKTTFTWYWLVYGYLIWEFSHFIYHYLAHKVRLFWCLHSTHHAPQSMNLSVTYAHFFLEAPYADFIRTSICILLGVNPPLLFFIMFVDGTWGAFIHVGENLMRDARLGFMKYLILTPTHHRVHHARNPAYMDTNFCNLLNVWDKLFKTFQQFRDDIPIQYGITRDVNPRSFLDVYFGEFALLLKDIRRAPGVRNKLGYLLRPPGWNHLGNHKTASSIRKEWLRTNQATSSSLDHHDKTS